MLALLCSGRLGSSIVIETKTEGWYRPCNRQDRRAGLVITDIIIIIIIIIIVIIIIIIIIISGISIIIISIIIIITQPVSQAAKPISWFG
jgi:uncharacterized membrane protein